MLHPLWYAEVLIQGNPDEPVVSHVKGVRSGQGL